LLVWFWSSHDGRRKSQTQHQCIPHSFFDKYATEFNFSNLETFGDTNPPVKRKINFMNMTSDAIEALPESDLKEALVGRGVDVSMYRDKTELVNKALSL